MTAQPVVSSQRRQLRTHQASGVVCDNAQTLQSLLLAQQLRQGVTGKTRTVFPASWFAAANLLNMRLAVPDISGTVLISLNTVWIYKNRPTDRV